jgi:hypothetical protein
LTRLEYKKLKSEGKVVQNGADVKVIREKGPVFESHLYKAERPIPAKAK